MNRLKLQIKTAITQNHFFYFVKSHSKTKLAYLIWATLNVHISRLISFASPHCSRTIYFKHFHAFNCAMPQFNFNLILVSAFFLTARFVMFTSSLDDLIILSPSLTLVQWTLRSNKREQTKVLTHLHAYKLRHSICENMANLEFS